MITKVSTKGMSNDQWLEARRPTIGGSEAATILGLNSYSSAYALWCEKTGKYTPEDISDKEAVRLGHDLEQYVAERFTEATGKKVRHENNIIYNSDYPFAHANPDRMVIGEKAGLECKTTSSRTYAKMLKEGNIPPYWYVQMTHYMMVTGCDHWYLGALVFGVGFYWFRIDREEAEIVALAAAEDEFSDLVKNNIPPCVDGSDATSDAIKTIFNESEAQTVDLTGIESTIENLMRYKRLIKEYEVMAATQENIIKEYMGSAEKGLSRYGSISWKSGTSKRLDRKKVEAKYGKLDDSFYNVTETRTFRTNLKEEE